MKKLRDSYLGQAWLVLLLSLVFGGVLAGVQVGLGERVELNKRNETLSRIPGLILGGELPMDARIELLGDEIRVGQGDGNSLLLRIHERVIAGHQVFEVASEAQGNLGWVARGKGPGYADTIEILIGLDSEASQITGLFVLSQKETPALGDGITRPAFTDRFLGAPADGSLEVTKSETVANANPDRILALTAATISSRSVSEIVNRTVADLRAHLLLDQEQLNDGQLDEEPDASR